MNEAALWIAQHDSPETAGAHAHDARSRFIELVGNLPGHWISNEGQGVVPGLTVLPASDGRFVLSVDGRARALTDPHGRSVAGLSPA